MKVLVVLLLVTAALAAPQAVESDAEVVPRRTVPGSSQGDANGDDGFVFVIPSFHNHNPFHSFFRNIFSRRPDVSGDGAPDAVDIPASERPGGFFSFIDSIFRHLPFPSDNSTVTFRNSTIEVINIGGVDMHVNRTIVERTDDNGSVYRRVDQRILGPVDDSTTSSSSSTVIPAAKDEANELEPEPSKPLKHTLKKRYVPSWLRDILIKHKNPSGTPDNHLPGTEPVGKDEDEERTPATHNLVPIGNEDDIAVNYLGVRPPHNPDAEVFDPELMRENERRFMEGRENSVGSQPHTSQPLASQPMMSQPMMSQPMMSQPLRSQPMMSRPLRSQPLMSQPLRTRSVRL